MNRRHPEAFSADAICRFVDGIYRSWAAEEHDNPEPARDEARVRTIQKFWVGYLTGDDVTLDDALAEGATFEFRLPEGHPLNGRVTGREAIVAKLDAHFHRSRGNEVQFNRVDPGPEHVEVRGFASGDLADSGNRYAIRIWHRYEFDDADRIAAFVAKPAKMTDMRSFFDATEGAATGA